MKVISKLIMSLSPRVLLSSASRERCVANLRELPTLVDKDVKPKAYASVLVPICVVDNEVSLLYTVRSMNLKNHSGQISFPGGKMDGNETVVETALRETEEEIGVPRESVDVWGEMKQVQGRNKEIFITPVVGEIKDFDMSKLIPSAHEVEEVFTVPISALTDKNNHAHFVYKTQLPIFVYGNHKIWGITGLITHMFLQSLLSEEDYQVDFQRKKFLLDELMPSKI